MTIDVPDNCHHHHHQVGGTNSDRSRLNCTRLLSAEHLSPHSDMGTPKTRATMPRAGTPGQSRHGTWWTRRRRISEGDEEENSSELKHLPNATTSMTIGFKSIRFSTSLLLATSYLLLLLVTINPKTSSASVTTTSLTGVHLTASNLAPDRVHIIRQAASNPSGGYKQTNKNFKEIFDKIVIHVKENTPIGTKLADVQPRDVDTGQHPGGPLLAGLGGSLLQQQQQQQQQHFADQETIYKIMPGPDAHLFTIRKDGHKIELINEVNFDYESPNKSYSVLIRASAIYFRYDLEVDILVEDENDNRPQLDDFAIVFNNYKNHFPTGPIGRVPATDLDVSDSLRFRVLSGNNAQLIIVNETNGDITLVPELNSNVPLRTVMDIAVSDGMNEAVAKLVLTVNLVTETMLHNSVLLRLDGMTRDDFLTRKYDIFLNELAKILGTSRPYNPADIVVFDVEESHHSLDRQQEHAPSNADPPAAASAAALAGSGVQQVGYRTAYSVHSLITNASETYVNVSFSARAAGHDVEAYLSRQHIEERIYLHRLLLSQALDAQVAPFQDDPCVHEPCQNYQECQVTYKFDRAPRSFITERNMIFRQIKATPGHTCICPPTFTGMKNKLECNLQINQCYTNPCLNGGLCHRHELGYTCQCRGEFFGARCEHSFLNSTCQSIGARSGSNLFGANSGANANSIQLDAPEPLAKPTHGYPGGAPSATACSGKSRCQNLSKFHQQYHHKFSASGGASSSSQSSLAAASSNSQGGFTCEGCSYASQWTNDLCQLRARSFERQTYLSLPSLRRRHRFHLMLQFATIQSDALLLYNGRYNDRHDFIALEIVDSHLRFSYSLGGDVFRVSLSSIPVADGEWHRVTVDYRDRNLTLMVDDCDPILDEAIARYQLPTSGVAPRRCSNTTTWNGGSSFDQTPGGGHSMLDLSSPMQLGALPANLVAIASSAAPADGSPPTGGPGQQQREPAAWSHLAQGAASSFAGCMTDLYIDHQLVDLSAPLQDFGTQPGCSDKRSLCSANSCNGHACQESFGAARCQCGEERLGRACELHLSQERVRKFSGNSYLTFNPIEAQIPHTWQLSLHFRSVNPNGILFKILLDSEASLVLELHNGGLRLGHRSRHLVFNKMPLDDGEWHFVELTWVGELTTQLQVDYNPNLMAQTSDLGQVAGATMRSVIVGAASSRGSSSSLADLQDSAGAPPAAASAPAPVAAAAAAAPSPESSPEFSPASVSSTPPPTLISDDAAYAYLYANSQANSSQSFVGCIYGLNISDSAEQWWQSPNEERNVERGCLVLDPCESPSASCPANSRCQRRGLNQRKCVCNPGFVGDLCVPVCELQPCRGENSRCVPVTASALAAELAKGGADSPRAAELAHQQYRCECEPHLSGRNCEHQLSPRCPANWWGRPLSPSLNSSICGPCNCDESRGFDGDCDKLTGQCFCKPNHYQPPDSDQCLACDCYLVGSLGISCNQTSGQCKCRPGVVGRRCDTCASPYAEVTLRGCEVIYDACPKTYSDGIWWDKTQLDKLAVQQCPASTSTGRATRFCHKTEGWQKANLFDCISNTFTDLLAQFKFLEGNNNKYQMSSHLAIKIASNLRQALNETTSSASMQLYGSDMYISFRLIHHLIQHESHQRGLNLTHRQDRAYIRNLAESISYILEPQYADNWPEIGARSPNGGAEHLLRLLDTYGRILIDSQPDTSTQPFEVSTKHLTFGMDTLLLEQLYDLSKWALPGGAPGASSPPLSPSTGHFPSSPPYATDPFEAPYGRPGAAGESPPSSPLPGGHFQPDGTSVYLDFSTTRDASPSVVIPKYDNYPASSPELPAAGGLNGQATSMQTRAFIPLKALKLRAPKEMAPGAWLGARSRAKRDEFSIPDYSSLRSQRPPLVVYSIFRTLGPLLPNEHDSSVQNRLGVLASVNSPVVWLTVRPQNSSEFLGRNVQPKITYTLKILEPLGKARPQCAIWDFSLPTGGGVTSSATSGPSSGAPGAQQHQSARGANATNGPSYGIKQTGRFTTRGCELRAVSPGPRGLRHKFDSVNCSCDHLGAVVVLMDSAAAGAGAYDYLAGDEAGQFEDLWLVVALSCSLLVLAATLFVLSCIRGHSIKSNSNSINKNLIVILILIELLILYSVLSRSSLNQREYACKLVAIFLHYFTISLFLWLLVNAIHFYRMLTELRDINHGPMKFYHVLGYAVPAFFVSLAVGLRMEQFGNHLFCWLSIHEPIIWSMFGPIMVVGMLVVLLFAMALCQSLPLDKMLADQDDPSAAELIKSHMLINIIKTPLIGFYSLLAVYAVNEALEGAAYLFPLAVVLKSALLFGLLCVLDKYIRYNMYVSWLRLKGEKVPFAEEPASGAGHYALGLGLPVGDMMGSTADQFRGHADQWALHEGGGYGLKGRAAAGQLLFPVNGGGGHAITPGFQNSCTDIFQPELLAGLSAASTTSNSSVTGTSSSATYREYRRAGGGGGGGGGHHHHHHHHHREEDLDEPDAGGYGRTRRHRRRHGAGAKKAHRKHHHHHHGGGGGGGGRHHHHHHHHHHASRHRSQHKDAYELESSTGGVGGQQGDYGHHHSHRGHRYEDEAAGGHYRRHHRHHRRREGDESLGSDRADSEQRNQQSVSASNSLDHILKNDELLASSHSSDRDDGTSRGRSPTAADQMTTPATASDTGQQHQQTVPMELVGPSVGDQQQERQTPQAKETSDE